MCANNKHKIVYANLDSTRTWGKHCETLPIPTPPDDRLDSIMDDMESGESESTVSGPSADQEYKVEI